MAVTIRDVARHAGVSPSTASRAFTLSGPVDPETHARVLAVAEELGYRRNRWASSLRGGATKKLAMIVPDLTNPFFADLVRGAQARAHELGYLVLVTDTDDDPRAESEMLASLADRVDGSLLCTPRTPDDQLGRLTSRGPTVLLHRTSDDVPYVISDVAQGVRLAVDNLVALGHRDIAYLDGPPESWSAGLRRTAIAALDLPDGVAVRTVGQVPARFEGGVAGGDLVVASGATAVLAFNDVVALGLLHRLVARGVRVPDDLSVVGYDDVPSAAMATPGLTTVAQPLVASARTGVDMLVDLVEGRPVGDAAVVLPTHLVVRSSTRAVEPLGRTA
ncbi:LacI family DNA-binding transcriptional regulator [Isoptericola sp. F-RaC21]|uniref:LacI family DNA-binding transcriptional regulator n=1 Tax=Isoptericola sp. F-RaC21 TaxID=3141452 RepID=UPI00315B68F5